MMTKGFWLTIILATLTVANVGMAQTAKDDIKGAGQDVKQAGKSTGSAAKKTGRATKKTVKKGVNKTAEKTAEGAEKVEQKTQWIPHTLLLGRPLWRTADRLHLAPAWVSWYKQL
jgi:hypothetical protein